MSNDTSKLLIDESPLQVLPTLACKVGLNGAIILQQVHYWLMIAKKAKDERKFIDGHWWVYNSYKEWKENFPWWSLPTIKRTIYDLEAAGLLISKEMNSKDWDHTKWYSINYDALNELTDCINLIPSEESERADQLDQSDTLLIESETISKTTPKKKRGHAAPKAAKTADPRTSSPEISLYRSVRGINPKKHTYDLIIKYIREVGLRLGRDATREDLLPFWEEWASHSTWNPDNLAWLRDWAVSGVIPNKGYSRPATIAAPPAQAPVYSQADREAAAEILAGRRAG